MDNYKMWIYRSVLKLSWMENQRGSIEKDGNRQRNSATIQDEENIRHNASQLQPIEGRGSRGRPRTTWITDLIYSTGAKYLYN